MTREEFDVQLNNDTVLGLVADRTKITSLRKMAAGFQRPDIAAILATLSQAYDVAVLEAERLGPGIVGEESLS